MRSIHATMIGVLLLLCGIFCLFSPVESSSVIPYLIGIALVATGIGKIFRWADEKRYFGQSRWNLAGAIISLLFGVLIIMSPALQLSMGASMIVLIGCCITMMGILRIVHAFKLRKIDAAYVDLFGRPVGSDWYMALLPGIAMTIIGIVNILHPSVGLGMVGALIGLMMLFCGSTLLSFGQMAWFW